MVCPFKTFFFGSWGFFFGFFLTDGYPFTKGWAPVPKKGEKNAGPHGDLQFRKHVFVYNFGSRVSKTFVAPFFRRILTATFGPGGGAPVWVPEKKRVFFFVFLRPEMNRVFFPPNVVPLKFWF